MARERKANINGMALFVQSALLTSSFLSVAFASFYVTDVSDDASRFGRNRVIFARKLRRVETALSAVSAVRRDVIIIIIIIIMMTIM